MMAAALSESGTAHDLFEEARSGRVVCVASTHVLLETERNLYRKAPRGLRKFWDLRTQLAIVDPPSDLVTAVAIDVEPKDAGIVAAAVAATVQYLVTYDRRHLLGEGDLIYQRFRIETITPGELLSRLTSPQA
jgi:predicted nucleic acid-binding protein